jgi:hypothetical protein
VTRDFFSSHPLAISLASLLPLRQVPLVLGMVRSMGYFISILKANSKGFILVGMFFGVVTKLYPNPYDCQQCNYENIDSISSSFSWFVHWFVDGKQY